MSGEEEDFYDDDDGTLNRPLSVDASETRKMNELTIVNTNARSLAPKIDSLVDCFEEIGVDGAVVTETWLRDGRELQENLSDLEGRAGIGSLTLNRDPHPTTGVSHGGVGFFYKKKIGSFKRINMPNPDKFEILPVIGNLRGLARKLVVVGVYIPPNYAAARGAACLEYLEEMIIDIKRRYSDPFVVVTGDFNQWAVGDALQEFADIREVHVGPTRGDRAIDLSLIHI